MKIKVMYEIMDENGEVENYGRAIVANTKPMRDREYIRKIEKKIEKELNKKRVKIFSWKVIGTIEERMKNK